MCESDSRSHLKVQTELNTPEKEHVHSGTSNIITVHFLISKVHCMGFISTISHVIID